MNNFIYYVKKTYAVYLVIAIILAIQLIVAITSIPFTLSQSTNETYFSLMMSISLMSLLIVTLSMVLVQGATLILSTFEISKLFGLNNRVSIRNTFKFVILKSVAISLVLNTLILIIYRAFTIKFSESLFGYNWASTGDLISKFLLIAIITYTLYALSMWIASAYRCYNELVTRVRGFTLAAVLLIYLTFLDLYLIWNQKGLIFVAGLIVISFLASLRVYKDMLNYERR